MGLFAKAILVSLPSFIYGFCLASLNSCTDPEDLGTIFKDIALTETEQQLANTLTNLGAWLGCYFPNSIVQQYGIRKVLFWNNLIFIVGSILCYFSNVYTFEVGKFVSGYGVGLASTLVPVVLAEISPPNLRGQITALHQLQITLGILVPPLLALGIVKHLDHGWRYLQLGPILPAIIQMVCYPWLPESPRWLLKYEGEEAARKMLYECNGLSTDERERDGEPLMRAMTTEVDGQLQAMQDALKQSESMNQDVSWQEVFAVSQPIIIGMALMTFNPLSGINSIIFYSTDIFKIAGFTNPIVGTASVGVVNVFMTIVCIFLIDRLGRKVLLVAGNTIMLVSLVILSIIILTLNSKPGLQGTVAVVGVLTYLTGFAIGFGAVNWVVLNEVVPNRIRTKAFSLFVATNWALNLLISFFTLSVIKALGGGSSPEQKKKGVGRLWIFFAAVVACSLVFLITVLKETKGTNFDIVASSSDLRAEGGDDDEAVQPLARNPSMSVNSSSSHKGRTA